MQKMKRLIELIRDFGIRVPFFKLMEVLTRKITCIHYWSMFIKQKTIVDFLLGENKDIIDEFNSAEHELDVIGKDYKVWVFWWQGFDNAPEVVKLCKRSVERYVPKEQLVLLDSTNYRNYVVVPIQYRNLLDNQSITITQFSDLLRLYLLYQRGGVWIDATYFLSDALPDSIPGLTFFSINHQKKKEVPVSRGLWSGSVLGFYKRNPVLKLIIDMYTNYFSKRTTLIDYLLTDHLFATCYDYCPIAKKMFDSVPVNNTGVDDMLLSMNNIFSEDLYSGLTKLTSMHKLNWKWQLKKRLNEHQTLYGYLVEKYME